ncbi:unnamed protein product [Effrenium voratum]|nr:unnamed protein product [Effrenium voratum]
MRPTDRAMPKLVRRTSAAGALGAKQIWLVFLLGLGHAFSLPRHSLPVSRWRKNSSHRVAAGDVRHFLAGDASPLLCEVGARVGQALPDKLKHKELFEAHAVAELAQRHLTQWRSEGLEVQTAVELCAGCGLVGIFLALLDRRLRVLQLDRRRSKLAAQLHEMADSWDLHERLGWRVADLRPAGEEAAEFEPGSLVLACHACGLLSDEAMAAAVAARLPLILLPCCYARNPKALVRAKRGHPSFAWPRYPWLERGAVNRLGRDAVDAARVSFLEQNAYKAVACGVWGYPRR